MQQWKKYTIANARTARIGDFSEGKGPILLTEVNCNKSHHRLIDCQTSTKIRNCIHLWDAGVTCQGIYNNNIIMQIIVMMNHWDVIC